MSQLKETNMPFKYSLWEIALCGKRSSSMGVQETRKKCKQRNRRSRLPAAAASAAVERNSCASHRHCPVPSGRARCFAEEAAGVWEADSHSLELRKRMCWLVKYTNDYELPLYKRPSLYKSHFTNHEKAILEAQIKHLPTVSKVYFAKC